jgi:hypothetical protein
MEYESITQKFYYLWNPLQNGKQFQHALLVARKQFYFVVSGLKIIDHGNRDNNLELPLYSYVIVQRFSLKHQF